MLYYCIGIHLSHDNDKITAIYVKSLKGRCIKVTCIIHGLIGIVLKVLLRNYSAGSKYRTIVKVPIGYKNTTFPATDVMLRYAAHLLHIL